MLVKEEPEKSAEAEAEVQDKSTPDEKAPETGTKASDLSKPDKKAPAGKKKSKNNPGKSAE